jgi:hypothetical protein
MGEKKRQIEEEIVGMVWRELGQTEVRRLGKREEW